MKFALVGLLPDVALAVWIETDEIWMCIGVADSSNEFAADADYDILLGAIYDLNSEVADTCFVDCIFTDDAEI